LAKASHYFSRPQSAAAQALANVIAGGISLTDALPQAQARVKPSRRALVQALCFGTLREQESLSFLRDGLLNKPLPRREADIGALLNLALFQILRSPTAPQKVVNDCVAATRELGKSWAAGLVNAVLRRFLREQEQQLARLDTAPQWVRHNLPKWLCHRLEKDWEKHPAQDAQGILSKVSAACLAHPPMTLRVNLAITDRDRWLKQAAAEGITGRRCQFSPVGVILDNPVDITALPGFEQGAVSVQDEAAQLVTGLLALESGQRVLDACAAPGGKTLAMLEQTSGLQMTAVDVDDVRLQRVRENLARAGQKAELVVADATAAHLLWREPIFDRILLDAPCSATGVIRRHPDIKCLRREADIANVKQIQAAMLDSLWKTLKPGGRLVYATCSILRDENDRQVKAFLARQPQAKLVPFDAPWGHDTDMGRQILPGENDMDGFFYAILEKPCAN